MITVSNEFKNAIKGTERRIKGYVEILYDVENVTVTPTSSIASTYTPLSDIASGGRVKQNYGTLDYLPLDGSYLTMDTATNNDGGFISNSTVEYIPTKTVTLSFSSTTLNGVTIYYKNNFPQLTNFTFSDSTTATIQTTGEEEYIQKIIFDEAKTLTSIQLEFDNWKYQDRKIKIEKIDLGLSEVYKDQDLVEFTIDEEVNKLVEEVPINETNVILNNISELFNPLNPQGIVKYLTEGSIIIPYIGVLTENLGVEYVKMGEFYFDSYTNNNDKTTTLVGKSIIKQVESATITDGLIATNQIYFLDRPTDTYNNTFKGLIENSGFPIDVQLSDKIMSYLIYIDNANMSDFIKLWCLYQNAIFLSGRNSNLIVKNIDFDTVDNLTKSELTNDVQYKYIDRINTLKRIRVKKENNDTAGSSSTYEMFKNYQLPLKESPQTFIVDKPSAHLLSNFTNTFSNGTGQILWDNQNFVIMSVTGNVGDTATLTSSWTSNYSSRSSSTVTSEEGTFTNKKTEEKENIIEIQDQIGFGNYANNYKNILDYTPSYEMSFEYNGDPSLEAGDYISVETPYGYKTLFIQKNTFKFNGGLSGSIEGVE